MKEYWNKLFKDRDKFFLHEITVEKKLSFFEGKKVIELGAGDGRNSIFLKNNGINITALDYSKEGLLKIKHKSPELKVLEIDVEKDYSNIIDYHLILMIHYFPNFEILKKIIEQNQKEVDIFIYTFIKEEVEGAKQTIGISYDEIEKIKKLSNVIELKFEDDPRGKSVLLIFKTTGDVNTFEAINSKFQR